MAANPAIYQIEVYNEIAAAAAASFIAAGIDSTKARAAAEAAAESVLRVFGGQMVYFPMGIGYKLARRNTEIRRRLAAGEDRAAMAREFSLTENQLRRIEADQRPSRGPRDAPTMPPRPR